PSLAGFKDDPQARADHVVVVGDQNARHATPESRRHTRTGRAGVNNNQVPFLMLFHEAIMKNPESWDREPGKIGKRAAKSGTRIICANFERMDRRYKGIP